MPAMHAKRRYALVATLAFSALLAGFLVAVALLLTQGNAIAGRLDHANWTVQGSRALQNGSARVAHVRFTAMLSVHPNSPHGWSGLVAALLADHSLGDIDAALADASAALGPEHPDTLGSLQARAAIVRSDWDAALTALDGMSANAEMRYLRSIVAYHRGDAAAFGAMLESIGDAEAQNTSLLFQLTREAHETHQRSAADRLAPVSVTIRKPWVAGNSDGLFQAVTELRDHAETVYLRGLLHEMQGRAQDAAQDYRHALAIRSDHAGAQAALTRLEQDRAGAGA
jgi:tetratricopeptide (TPR) repeat protein